MKKTRIIRNKKGVFAALLCVSIILCSLFISLPVSAASYQGSGTEADPYLVQTAEQLQDMRKNVSAHYKLANTIDLSSISNFTPIGNLEKPFTGSFVCELGADGLPLYAIKNLKISVAETDYIDTKVNRWECALFGAAEGATFMGIYVLDVNLSNKNFGDNTGAVVYGNYKPGMDEMNAGALVGQANSCTIANCASSGKVDGRNSYAGGLIGYAVDSQISACYTTATVKSTALFAVGGLMGCSRTSVVDKCYSTGNVTAGERGAAPFIGSVYSSSITNCYTSGNISAQSQYVTNFTGDRETGTSSYENCFATGTIKAGGGQTESSNVTNCWTLKGTKSFMIGFKEGSAADIKAAFSSLAGWDTSGKYPTLTDIPVLTAEKKASYVPGAVTTVTPNADSTVSGTTSGNSTVIEGGSTTGAEVNSEELLKKFIAAVEALPAAETVTKENLDAIIEAQKLYEQLPEDVASDLSSEIRSKFMSVKTAVQEIVLIELKTGIEELPDAKKIKASHKEEVMYLYDLYNLLSDDAKLALDSELQDKLLACYETASKIDDSQAAVSNNLTTPEIILIIVLSVMICCAIAFCVFNNIRTYNLLKRISVDSDEDILDEDIEND